MKKKKKFIILAIILLIAGGLVFSMTRGGGEQGTPVYTADASMGDIQNTVSIKGTVQGIDSADVFSVSTKEITSVCVQVGDRVTAGQLLATLETNDVSSQYNIDMVNLRDAEREYSNAKQLYEEGAISKQEYLQAESAYTKAQYAMGAYNNAETGRIESPITGTVTRVNCTVGRIPAEANKGEAMFVIENVDELVMKVKVSEHDIASIKVGQNAVVSAEILGNETITGVVTKISPTGEASADGKMVIPVEIRLDKGDTNIIAGVSAKAKISTDSVTNVLTVPGEAVVTDIDTGEEYVFVVNEDNTIKKVIVETGLEGDILVEITGGDLKAGDTVVLAPESTYEDGMLISRM